MPNWHDIHNEFRTLGSTHDVVRRRYLKALFEHTGRNAIVYYSGWLQKPGAPAVEVNDNDKTGFMAVVHRLDPTKGLDLLLHTPGGNAAATESIVYYLRQIFNGDIRVIVPELAMSAGTMIACAARKIVMGHHSSLGPIDPQLGNVPAHGVVEEFYRAYQEIRRDPAMIPVWQPIIAKYPPSFIGECEKAIKWANEMVKDWLMTGMFNGLADAEAKADRVVKEFGDHALTMSHTRHIPLSKCKDLLVVEELEADATFQDKVLSVHHACIHTLTSKPTVKIIENHDGVAFVQNIATVMVPQQQM